MANITLHGNAVHTVGNLPEVGTKVKDFKLVNVDLKEQTNNDFAGKKRYSIFSPALIPACVRLLQENLMKKHLA